MGRGEVGIGAAAINVVLAIFGRTASRMWKLMIALGAVIFIVLAYLTVSQFLENSEISAARVDIEAMLAANRAATFQDLYAQISPRRDLEVLTTAIDIALRDKTVEARTEVATLGDNRLVGVRVYELNPGPVD